MDFKFKPGEIVRMKHVASQSSPFMVVVGQALKHPEFENANPEQDINWYLCRWFWQGDFKTDGFREEELEKVGS